MEIIENIIFYFFTSSAIVYSATLIYLSYKLGSAKIYLAENRSTKVSIIIPFRNESDVIKNTLISISKQSYDLSLLELILVDDGSNDNSKQEISTVEHIFPCIKLFQNESKGKKSALLFGLKQSSFDTKVIIDADTFFERDWLKNLVFTAEKNNADVLFGPVKYENRFLDHEYKSVVGVGGVMTSLGIPLMVNGANILLRNSFTEGFIKHGLNFSSPSGDDQDILFYAIKNKKKVSFTWGSDVTGITSSSHSLFEFFLQRLRWASKWQNSIWSSAVSSFIALMNICLFLISVFNLSQENNIAFFISAVVFKFLVEGLFIYKVGLLTGSRFSLLYHLTWTLLYPFYSIVIGFLTIFKVKINWKERIWD